MEGREGKGYRIYLSTIFFFLDFICLVSLERVGEWELGGQGAGKNLKRTLS